jgi:hypothetical protein
MSTILQSFHKNKDHGLKHFGELSFTYLTTPASIIHLKNSFKVALLQCYDTTLSLINHL